MKLLSFAIPCYNSESYMEKCIESILIGGEEVEILIVNDGSKDRTAEIADAYAAKYPTICRAIHQENGGPSTLRNEEDSISASEQKKIFTKSLSPVIIEKIPS